ncbi:MAG: PIN domain-containing protein [Candidatus Micrarchaeota archaeon]
MILVDSSAWIELIKNGRKAGEISRILEKSSVYCIGVSIAEVSKWCESNGFESEKAVLDMLKTCDDIIEPTVDALRFAGKLNVSINRKRGAKLRQISLIDCILAATVTENQLKVLTLDEDFSSLNCDKMLL